MSVWGSSWGLSWGSAWGSVSGASADHSVSNNFKQTVYAQETDNVFIVLLTFTSDELSEPIYISNDPYELLPTANVRGVVSNGIEYIHIPFDIKLPKDDRTGVVTSKLVIDNVSRSLIQTVRSISEAVNVKIQVVLSNNVDYVEIKYDHFKLTDVEYNVMEVSGNISQDYWGLEPFPSGRFTPSNFPGLF